MPPKILGPHTTPKGMTTTWLTPKWIVDALGPFDLDPCCPEAMPWRTATEMIQQPRNGLVEPWKEGAYVWMNPPYDRDKIEDWIYALRMHECRGRCGSGIALVFVRTGTQWGQRALQWSDAVYFIKGRIKFCDESGTPAKASAGCDSMLLAFGDRAVKKLREVHETKTIEGILYEANR